VARFHASYAIMQKVRRQPRALLCHDAALVLSDATLVSQAHFAALKQRQKEKTKPAGKAAAVTPA